MKQEREGEVRVQRAITAKIRSLESIQWESLVPGSLLGNAIWGAGGKEQKESHKEGDKANTKAEFTELAVAVSNWLLVSKGSP